MLLAIAPLSQAHQFAPALLQLTELDSGQVDVRWKQPISRVVGSHLQPVLPADCAMASESTTVKEKTGLVSSWTVSCPAGLAGSTVRIDGISGSRADALLRIIRVDGSVDSQLLTAEEASYTVGDIPSSFDVAMDYIELGADHILTGWDHLLFVLALVLIIGWGSALLWTITAFTVGHSITLAVAALGFVSMPPAPIEVGIALSILYLAYELMQKSAGKPTLVVRYPWFIASAFGLLHGMGFAGALTEIGLPANEIPLALFAFNIGIELGQLAFVVAVLMMMMIIRRLPLVTPAWGQAVPAYFIGSMAVFWILERVVQPFMGV